MIAILCPTRGRPEQYFRMYKSVVNTASTSIPNNVSIFTCASKEDQCTYQVPLGFFELPDNLPTAHKWNILAEEAMKNPKNKLFMLGADDMIFETEGWDKALIDHYNALNNKIHCYALQDSRDTDGTPHVILTREWIEALGYFVPPVMLHWYIDTWTVEVAKSNGVFTHLRDYSLVHDKPSDIGRPDETFSRIRSFGWKERDDYVNKTCRHFLEVEKERLRKCLQ